MKQKKNRASISLLVIVSLLALCFVAPAASANSFMTNPPTGVNGRILTTDKTGDSSDWIEIAQNGNYSLIVRKNYVNHYSGRYGDPSWQYVSYGATNAYMNSSVRRVINNWFNNNGGYADNLPLGARLRSYTVLNNAKDMRGTCNYEPVSMKDGLSSPSATAASTGDDVAFALSYSESANFISRVYFRRYNNIANATSNDIARANFAKLNIPIDTNTHGYGMWLRSPGDINGTAGALCGGNPSSTFNYGRVFQFMTSGGPREAGLIYPALWVDQAVFETKYPISVHYYKDSISPANLLGTVPLAPALPGTPINDVNMTLYAPNGYSIPGTRSGDYIVAPRENNVYVVYSIVPSLVMVQYYKDYVGGQFLGTANLLLSIPLGGAITGIDATLYAPPGYEVPGKLLGDKVIKEPYSLVFVVYEAQQVSTTHTITVTHMFQESYGSAYYLEIGKTSFTAKEGEWIDSSTKAITKLVGYEYDSATPPALNVTKDNTSIVLKYKALPNL